jgi:CubicO group peptidase (beta-lactamase class C family)
MAKNLQDTIQSLLNSYVAEGKQRGAQVAVYLEGQLVVDAWGGIADVRTGRPVEGDTVFPVFSTTKGIFATVIHILAERGRLDYDTPIAAYWPEFAAHGKEAITLRHALSHTSGVPYMPEGVTLEQISDWDFMCAALADMNPSSSAGAKQVYHPVTYGWLLGEVARRVEGRHVPQLLKEEICEPLGMSGLYCGIPAELEPETAFLELIPNPPVEAGPPPHGVSPCMQPLHEWMNCAESRRTPQPGSTGIMSARAVARHYAALLPGGVDGVELLPPERVRLAMAEQVPTGGYEKGSGRWGLGYGLGLWGSASAFGSAGHGGSTGYIELPRRLAVGITRNLYCEHDLAGLIAKEIRAGLGMA